MLRDFRDLDPDDLLEELRCPRDAQHRRQAAQALGALKDDLTVVPWLLNSVLHDPDALVQRAARETLRDLIGGSLEDALRLEANGEALANPWLAEHCILEEQNALQMPDDWADEDESGGMNARQGELLHGLTLVVRGEPNPALRIKAVHALGKIPDMEAIRVLAELTLSEAEEPVRAAARAVLEQRFGDDLPGLLDFYRRDWGEEGDSEPETQQAPRETERQTVRRIAAEHPPVIEEENRGRWVWVALGALAIGALLLALVTR